MADDVDATLREAQQTIAKSEALLKQVEEQLQKSEQLIGDANLTDEQRQAFVARQGQGFQAAIDSELQAFRDELERDAPKPRAEPARQTRVRPGRQMV